MSVAVVVIVIHWLGMVIVEMMTIALPMPNLTLSTARLDGKKCHSREGKKMHDCGVLNRKDAREFSHWWTIRGHTVTLAPFKHGLVRAYLKLKRRKRSVWR